MSASANSAAMSGQLQKWFPALYNEQYRNKLLQRGKNWSVSIGIALGTLGFAVVYFTEWRDIMEKVPVLKSKYEGKPREQ